MARAGTGNLNRTVPARNFRKALQSADKTTVMLATVFLFVGDIPPMVCDYAPIPQICHQLNGLQHASPTSM